MIQLERILVPTDFSEASKHALPHAFELARRFTAVVTLVHVRTPFSGDPSQPEHHFFDEGKYEDYVACELEETSKGAGSGVEIKTLARRNISAASGILEAIEEDNIDMVAMGTHGRSDLAHFFLGSVAEKVVRYSPVPVLTVAPNRADYRQEPSYSRVLATFDFSKHSIGALKGALRIADKYGAHLQVLYVIEQAVHPGYHEAWKESMTQDVPAIEAEARRALLGALGEEGIEGAELCVEVGTGDGKAYGEISRFAEEQQTDLIVMGTYGLSGVQHMLLGSTTERVVRTAPCPVLTFHLSDSATED